MSFRSYPHRRRRPTSGDSRTRRDSRAPRHSRASSQALPSGRSSQLSAGLLVSAAVWALASHSGNYHHASMGRRGTLISALAAFLVGAAPAIVAFFENLGRTVK